MRAPQFLYEVEGERKAGTLIDYTVDIEHCYYSSLDIGPLLDLYGNPIPMEKFTYQTEDDYAITELTLSIDGEEKIAKYRIDLRA